MNLHWGGTLANRHVNKAHHKRHHHNHTVYFPYNYTAYKLTQGRYAWRSEFNRTAANHSALLSDNTFLSKTRLLADMMDHPIKRHSFTTVMVIAGLFLFVTMAVTTAVLVFCRKRNSIFALQKSEQEDMELEDYNTDLELTETDFDSENESLTGRPASLHSFQSNTVAHKPDALPPKKSSRLGDDKRGAYQKMVVTAVLEKQIHHSDSEEETEATELTAYTKHVREYGGVIPMPTQYKSDSDSQSLTVFNTSSVNASCAEDHSVQHNMVLNSENNAEILSAVSNKESINRYNGDSVDNSSAIRSCPKNKSEDSSTCVLYVNLPPQTTSNRGSVICVKIPTNEITGHNHTNATKTSYLEGVCFVEMPNSPTSSHTDNSPSQSGQIGTSPSYPFPHPPYQKSHTSLDGFSETCHTEYLAQDMQCSLPHESPSVPAELQHTCSVNMKTVKSFPEYISAKLTDTGRPQCHRSGTSYNLDNLPHSDFPYESEKPLLSNRTDSNADNKVPVHLFTADAAIRKQRASFETNNTQHTQNMFLSSQIGEQLIAKELVCSPCNDCVTSPLSPLNEHFATGIDVGEFSGESEMLIARDTLSMIQ